MNILEAKEANKTRPVRDPSGCLWHIGSMHSSDAYAMSLEYGVVMGKWEVHHEPRKVEFEAEFAVSKHGHFIEVGKLYPVGIGDEQAIKELLSEPRVNWKVTAVEILKSNEGTTDDVCRTNKGREEESRS